MLVSSQLRSVVRAFVLALAVMWTSPAWAQAQDSPTYWVYVANESSDIVSKVRFDGEEVVEDEAIEVGFHPMDLDGAHGITVSPSGEHWYVSIAHGQPYGQVWKMETATDAFVDSAVVGLFPATMSMTPDGSSLFVVNFNLHGDHIPSSVSAVFTPVMQELSQIETCVMPHGSRVSNDGMRHYSTCMMSDRLVETAISELSVSRKMILSAGQEGIAHDETGGMVGMDGMRGMGGMSGIAMGGEGVCKPTWVVVSPDDTRLYVPCNGRDDVLEIDAESMTLLRKWPAGRAPYNADITPDGSKLVVTLKGEQAVAIYDVASGEETARLATSQPVTHGVVISPDGRYAFVTNEAVGATRGTIDVVDLLEERIVASTELHYQPGGIGVWKIEPAGS
ncbi:MAG: YncE family protein [Gemmatimonadales bacterium]|nr:YncE family protein [Gemmatimonadales bacterium]